MCSKRMSAGVAAVCAWVLLSAASAEQASEPEGAWAELGEVEITSDTAWVEGQYRAQNLRVGGSATLSIAGGSTVEIVGALTVADTATVLCQGKDTEGQAEGVWAGAGVTLLAGSATVDAGARITADAMGYGPTVGPGYGGNVWDNGSGGSYGGWGGRMGGSDAGGAPYGSLEEPTDLGSGGGWSTAGARAGGGALRLVVGGELLVNGRISADGQAAPGGRAGAGSGGSVWIAVTGSLSGSGAISAKGGDTTWYSGAGGGGRVAVYAASVPFAGTLSAGGGLGGEGSPSGGAGSVYLSVAGQAGDLRIDNHDLACDRRTPLLLTRPVHDLILRHGATVELTAGGAAVAQTGSGELRVEAGASLFPHSALVFGSVTVQAAGVLGHLAGDPGLTLTTVADAVVEAGGRITADAMGYGPATGPGYGGSVWDNGSGGSYGGWGGRMTGSDVGGAPYGSIEEPSDLGSGGGWSTAGARAGGGALRLIVGGALRVDGAISADGQASTDVGGRAGAGSGGSVWITANGSLTGSGAISANGGDSAWAAGAGGGGRVAVYAATLPFAGTISAGGGQGGSASPSGGAGTVCLKAADWPLPDLILNNGGRDGDRRTPLELTHTLRDLRLEDSAEVELTTAAAAATLTGSGELSVGPLCSLYLQSGVVFGSIHVWGSAAVTAFAGEAGFALTAIGDLTLDSGGAITADALGYGPGAGPGYGGTSGGNHGAGGSYGGLGGWSLPPPVGLGGGGTYGTAEWPTDFGSGGGYGGGWAVAGGGALRLFVGGDLRLDGSVSARGQATSAGGRAGAGSGGGVWITVVGTFSGSGLASADGGDAGSMAGAGGGGRMLIEAGALVGSWTAHANGGVGYAAGYCGAGGSLIVRSSGGNSVPARNFAAQAGGDCGNPDGCDGSLLSESVASLRWSVPPSGLVHGQAPLTWTLLGEDFRGGSVALFLLGNGEQTLIAADVPAWERGVIWDSTSVADGIYEFLVVAHTDAGLIVEARRQMLVNNSVLWHSGRLTAAATWNADRVHVVDSLLTVPDGVRLTIAAGAVVKFAPGTGITIEAGGVLDLQSGRAGVTVLTALTDDSAGGDTNLDGSTSVPVVGSWLGLRDAGGTLLAVDSAEVRYAPPVIVGYTLQSSQTWHPWAVYLVRDPLIIPAGVTLTVLPGTVVKFEAEQALHLQPGGTLVALGTLAQPIWFTSVKDDSVGGDSNGDGDATVPYSGDWLDLHNGGGSLDLDHVCLSYGGGETNGSMVGADGGVTSIRNSRLAHALYRSVSQDRGASVELLNCLVYDGDWALENFDGTLRVINCTIDRVRSGIVYHGGSIEVVNTIVSNYTELGLYSFGRAPALPPRSCNLWGTGSQTTWGDIAGSNGNIAVDPTYRDPARGDYRLGFVSPCIDAGDGLAAPVLDALGAPRYDDPRSPNTGIADAAGAFADLGAFEFAESADSQVDLLAKAVSGPLTVLAGEVATVTWRVANVGPGTASGPWHDSVYLVPAGAGRDGLPVLEVGTVLVGHGAALGPGQELALSAAVRIPGGLIGRYRYRVEANSRGGVFEGRNRANNAGLSATPVDLDLPELALGAEGLDRAFTAAGQSQWFKVVPGAGKDLMVTVTRPDTGGVIELYVARGYVPTDTTYDATELPLDRGTATLRALMPAVADADVPCYVAVYCRTPGGQARAVTVSARELGFEVVAFSPQDAPTTGEVTFELFGGGLAGSLECSLVASGGVTRVPMLVGPDGSTHMLVNFDMDNAPEGPASLYISTMDRALRSSVTVGLWLSAASDPTDARLWTAKVTISAPDEISLGQNSFCKYYYEAANYLRRRITATMTIEADPSLGGQMVSFTRSYGFGETQVRDSQFGIAGMAEGRFPISATISHVHSQSGEGGTTRKMIWVKVSASKDPNDKYGDHGSGLERFLSPSDPLVYTVAFENTPDATAPARFVTVTDRLDPAKVDVASFGFGRIHFGATTVEPPRTGLPVWSETVDLRPARELLVQVDAALDATTGEISWRFQSIDPLTRLPTEDPRAGFLPPNVTAPEGDGSVAYSVRPKADLPTGTRFEEHATIVFDYNDPIDTPAWLNTIDAGAPEGVVESLPAVSAWPLFLVRWGGTDDAGGSGIVSYSVDVSTDGGDFEPWQTDTSGTEAVFAGERGHSYAFYAVARDGVGNTEIQAGSLLTEVGKAIVAEAQTTVPLLTTDTDRDGVPDWYEARVINADAHDAMVGFAAVLPWADFDGDGASNLHEYRAGTDPASALSVPGTLAAPVGEFLAVTDVVQAAAGRGLWDLTGTYVTSAASNPLVLNLVHDSRGRLTGSATCTVAKAAAVTLPIRGSVRAVGGAPVATLALQGADAAGSTRVSLALRLTLAAATRQLGGPMTGSVRVGGVTTAVAELLALPLPAPMDGSWTLALQLGQGRRSLTGTAVLTLSNGVHYAYVVRGRRSGAAAVLTLGGDPADPAAGALSLRATVLPQAGNWGTLQDFSGTGYGQALTW